MLSPKCESFIFFFFFVYQNCFFLQERYFLLLFWQSIRDSYLFYPFLSRIWVSHGGEYEDGCLLGCSAVWSGRSLPTFQTTRRYNPEDSHIHVRLFAPLCSDHGSVILTFWSVTLRLNSVLPNSFLNALILAVPKIVFFLWTSLIWNTLTN
jgi:hypothetical protein